MEINDRRDKNSVKSLTGKVGETCYKMEQKREKGKKWKSNK